MADQLVATFMIVMGLAIAGVWTADIVRGTEVDRSRGLLRARDSDGALLGWHWFAEYGTAGVLLVGAVGLLVSSPWAVPVAAAALGATWYTSANSLGWALAERSRRAYAAPMAVGLVGSLVCLGALLASTPPASA
jgi:hypothetical protein